MIRTSFRVALSALLFAGALGLASTGAAQAQSIMKQCGDEWKAAKANNTTNGLTWPQFLKQCRTEKEGAAAPAPTPAAAPAPAPAPAPLAPAPAPTTYHYSGSRWYGTTKQGAYMCEADAGSAGYHASKSRTEQPKQQP
jgi:hypothetical protein